MSPNPRRAVAILAVVAAAALAGCAPRARHAELVLVNGRIVTLDPARPEARALAAGGDTILAVGSDAEIRAFVGPETRVIDLGGRLAIPGFIEGHGHFMSLGRSRRILDLTTARTWAEIAARVGEAARRADPGEWITGRGWHQEKWDEPPVPAVEGFPTHDALSRAAPENPVLLTHASGHATIVNARAMALSGIGGETPDPPGGEILRDRSGAPTGLLRERASDLAARALEKARAARTPEQAEAEALKEIELATRECLAKGITSFQDAGSSLATIERFRRLAAEGRLELRLWVMIRESNEALAAALARARTVGSGGDRLTVRAVKRTLDGALGSRGAWLLEPYADSPASVGIEVTPVAELRETARLALEHGFQLCVHAIGDRANREALNVFEDAFRSRPDLADLRWRIEHVQHLSPADIPRFGALGVVASMQGIHCTSDAPWVLARLGERRAAEGAYVWRKLLDAGAVIVNGTDAPVEDVSPIASFHATVTRRLADGTAFYPEQRMSREEALRSYTLAPAYAAFEETLKGSLAPGKLADVTVLSRDILQVPDDEILGAEVVYTIVGGKVAYAAAAVAGKR